VIRGGASDDQRCDRPGLHPRHVWVRSPLSKVDHACDGRLVERDEVLVGLAVSAA
jgi:hypothetical protein